MLGLAMAWRLQERGHRVTVVEAADAIGGLTRHFESGDSTWDRFYHVIDASDQSLIRLLDDIGLAQDIRWTTTQTLLYDGYKHYSLNNARDYLRLPVLSLVAKLRIGLNIVYAGARKRRGGLEHISAERWLCRWSGRNAYEQLWAPLLRSKLGESYDKVSATFIWSVIRRFYGARQGSQRTEQFGFISGGYARVIATLEAALNNHGVRFITGHPVEGVDSDGHNRVQIVVDGNSHTFDKVIATYSGPLVARTLSGLDAKEKAQHAALAYQGVVCLSLLMTRPLGGAYMTYITDNSIPFTTVIEMSALTGTAHYGDRHLVYLPRYIRSNDPLLDAGDEEIRRTFLAGLKRMYPDVLDEHVISAHIARARYVMTLPVLDYSAVLPPMETSITGLYVCNSAQIVDASLSVNEAVALADHGLGRILAHA